MKNLLYYFYISILVLSSFHTANGNWSVPFFQHQDNFITDQTLLDANNISTWIQNNGTFNQNIQTPNTPGFMWPKGSGKFAIFTSGITIGAFVNNSIRTASAMYGGEFRPGYCKNGIFYTNSTFKLYNVKATDNPSSPDWANWGLMVPYGAPFNDINNNGIYEPFIDKPGIKDAAQTIFLCMTDADSTAHNGSGFPGGTKPLGAEVHTVIWCYNTPGLENVNFMRWVIVNKSNTTWTNSFISLAVDPDLGDGEDDYIGCDTSLKLGYCYNSDNFDGDGTGNSYGSAPPAVGVMFLNHSLTSFDYFTNVGSGGVSCEQDPSFAQETYNYMSGLKKDSTKWLMPSTLQPTKFCFTGDPVSLTGWSERGTNGNINQAVIKNCGGSLTGTPESSPPGDRRFVMSCGGENLTITPGQSFKLDGGQLAERGSNNLNSFTKLISFAGTIQNFYNTAIGVTGIGSVIPENFKLYQNYPNPFNPVTKIKFDIPQMVNGQSSIVKLKIYDITGKEIAILVNQHLNPGAYEAEFDGSRFASGVYFYRLETESFSEMKKMILIK